MGWLELVGLVVAANIVTGFFVYFAYEASKAEREGRDSWRLPLHVYLCGLFPLLLIIVSLLSVKP
jgi:hypothetical protein